MDILILTNIWYILQVASSSELVGNLEELSSLETEYAQEDLIYQQKIQVLNKLIHKWLQSNIYLRTWRASTLNCEGHEEMVTVSLEPSLLHTWRVLSGTRVISRGRCEASDCGCMLSEHTLRFREAVVGIRDSLLANGYPSFTLEDFHDTVSSLPSCYAIVWCGLLR